MTLEQYRTLRNRLQANACVTNVYSPEYKNLLKRIKIIEFKMMLSK